MEWEPVRYKLSSQAMQKFLEPRKNSGLIVKCSALSPTILIPYVKPFPLQKVT